MAFLILVWLAPVAADLSRRVLQAAPADCCRNWTPECYSQDGEHNKYHACRSCGPQPCRGACETGLSGDPGSRACELCCQRYPDHEVDWQCDAVPDLITPSEGDWLLDATCDALDTGISSGGWPNDYICRQQHFYIGNWNPDPTVFRLNETTCLQWCKSWGLPGCCQISIGSDGRGECDLLWDSNPRLVSRSQENPGTYSALMSVATEGLGCLENFLSSSTTTTTTTTTRETVTAIVDTSYFGPDGANGCGPTSRSLGHAECERLAMADVVSLYEAVRPKGCFHAGSTFSYNKHPVGAGRTGTRPVCKTSKTVEYIIAEDGSNSCLPEMSVSRSECEDMPALFGGVLHPLPISEAHDPRGCFRFGSAFYFNEHPEGQSRIDRSPVCKRVASELMIV